MAAMNEKTQSGEAALRERITKKIEGYAGSRPSYDNAVAKLADAAQERAVRAILKYVENSTDEYGEYVDGHAPAKNMADYLKFAEPSAAFDRANENLARLLTSNHQQHFAGMGFTQDEAQQHIRDIVSAAEAKAPETALQRSKAANVEYRKAQESNPDLRR